MTVWQKALPDGVTIVGITGRLDQVLTPQLENSLLTLLNEGHHQIIVDMGGVDYINSSGLRVLVTAWRSARQQNGNLVLCGLNQRVGNIFAMVGFDKVFKIYATCEQAQATLHPSK